MLLLLVHLLIYIKHLLEAVEAYKSSLHTFIRFGFEQLKRLDMAHVYKHVSCNSRVVANIKALYVLCFGD